MRRVFEPESGGDVAEMKSLDVEYVFEFAREGGVRADVGAERILGQDVVRLSDATLARSFLHALGGGMEMGHALNMDLSRSVASFASSRTLSMATADPSAKETPSSASTSAYSRSLGCKRARLRHPSRDARFDRRDARTSWRRREDRLGPSRRRRRNQTSRADVGAEQDARFGRRKISKDVGAFGLTNKRGDERFRTDPARIVVVLHLPFPLGEPTEGLVVASTDSHEEKKTIALDGAPSIRE